MALVFSSPEEWLEHYEQDSLAREKEILGSIKERVALFAEEVAEPLVVLESVDVSAAKAGKRAENIVKNNIRNYVRNVRDFAEEIQFEGSLGEVVAHFNQAMLELHKRNNVAYQKASYLARKELIPVHNCLAAVSKDVKELVDEELVVTLQTLASIKAGLAEREEADRLVKEVRKNVVRLKKELTQKKKDEKARVEKVKESKEYLAAEENRKELARSEKRLSQAYVSLKSLVDFKALGKVFHGSKRMADVTALKNDFSGSFSEQKLRSLLSEAKQTIPEEKIAAVVALRAKIKDLQKQLRTAPMLVEEDFASLESELDEEEKKVQKLSANKEEIDAALEALL